MEQSNEPGFSRNMHRHMTPLPSLLGILPSGLLLSMRPSKTRSLVISAKETDGWILDLFAFRRRCSNVAPGMRTQSLGGSPPLCVSKLIGFSGWPQRLGCAYRPWRRRSLLDFCHPSSPVWDAAFSRPCCCWCWKQCSVFPWYFWEFPPTLGTLCIRP